MRDETRADKRKETSNVQRRKGAWRPRRLRAQRPTSNRPPYSAKEDHSHHRHAADEHEPSQQSHEMQMEMSMHSTIDLADPMSREGSGTSWIPDSSPMYGRMFMFGENMLMLHGAIFPRYTNVSTRRGDDRIDAPNWFMAMFSHPLGDSAQFGSRLMMSLDPLTEGGRGYPLLFQTGESWNGEALHDRQHPHDLFDELSFSLSQKFEHDLSAYIYFGYPGEPALGPPTFMHRPSAMDDPDAPIGHHWQDSTHITFGVATAGLVWNGQREKLKAAFSPGANRMKTATISISRISIRTAADSPGTRHEIWRCKFRSVTSKAPKPSILNSTGIARPHRQFTICRSETIAIGRTVLSGAKTTTQARAKRNHSWLNPIISADENTVYFRWERVEKSGQELVLNSAADTRVFPVGALHTRLRARPVARQRHRHRSRYSIHNQ